METDIDNDIVIHDIGTVEVPGHKRAKVELDDDVQEILNKRIGREVRKTKLLQNELEEVKSSRVQLEQRLAALEASQANIQVSQHQNEIDSAIAEKNRLKAELLEVGEFQKVVDLDNEIMDLKVKKATSPVVKPQPQPQPVQRQEQQQKETRTEAEKEWLARNDWFHNPDKAELKEKAIKVYQELVDSGYDPDDDELYAEIDKRIALPAKDNKRELPPPNQTPVDRGEYTETKGIKFSQEDAQRMTSWGLDANNPKARAEYLKNKAGA